MGLRKCPRCELNYIRDDEKLCDVCSRKGRSSLQISARAPLHWLLMMLR